MKKQLLIGLALMLGGQLPAAQAQTTLAGDHQVKGNLPLATPTQPRRLAGESDGDGLVEVSAAGLLSESQPYRRRLEPGEYRR